MWAPPLTARFTLTRTTSDILLASLAIKARSHVNWQTAVAAGFGKLVAQPALLEAYVEAVIANHRGGQSLSNCRKTTHIEHYASPHAGERVCVAATIKSIAGAVTSYEVTVESERGNLLAAGTIDIVRQ
jgi:predicted thioesterase